MAVGEPIVACAALVALRFDSGEAAAGELEVTEAGAPPAESAEARALEGGATSAEAGALEGGATESGEGRALEAGALEGGATESGEGGTDELVLGASLTGAGAVEAPKAVPSTRMACEHFLHRTLALRPRTLSSGSWYCAPQDWQVTFMNGSSQRAFAPVGPGPSGYSGWLGVDQGSTQTSCRRSSGKVRIRTVLYFTRAQLECHSGCSDCPSTPQYNAPLVYTRPQLGHRRLLPTAAMRSGGLLGCRSECG